MAVRDWSDVPGREGAGARQPDDDQRLIGRDRDLEAPEADMAEQTTPATPDDLAEQQPPPRVIGFVEASEHDVIEQREVVVYDDDYRP